MGRRRHGHFDHDANSEIGPHASSARKPQKELADAQKEKARKKGVLLKPLERVVDPKTGFVTYKEQE